MCTLIAFHHVWRNAPLVIACNRDEAYDRPASGPVWSAAAPAVLAPIDDRAGGTWMGASANGVWVGITNRDTGIAYGETSRTIGDDVLLQQCIRGHSKRILTDKQSTV